MTTTDAPLHRIGRIPDPVLWEGDLAFRIDLEGVDPPGGRPELARVRAALEFTRATLPELAQLTIDHPSVVELIAQRLGTATEHIAAAAQAVAQIASTQTSALSEASAAIASALATAHGLPAMFKTYHHSANKRAEEQRLTAAFGLVRDQSAIAAQKLEAAIPGLATEVISLQITPRPHGAITFDAQGGSFSYRRADDDRTPFQLDFATRIGGELVRQSVCVRPIPPPNTVAELLDTRLTRDLFGSQVEHRHGSADGTTVVYTGLDIAITQSMFDGGARRIEIDGHIVRVRGAVKSKHGAVDLAVFARYLVFEPDASIDVSGRHGEDRDDTAGSPKDADICDGDHGAHGDKGHDGETGGAIDFVAERVFGTPRLVSNGGLGGRGQNGGPGHKGVPGGPGGNDLTEEHGVGGITGGTSMVIVTTAGGPGGPGGTGGKGGNAGPRGDAGSGGAITLGSVLPCLELDARARPGQEFATAADTDAVAGAGGVGGSGGSGGSHYAGKDFWGMPSWNTYPPGDPGKAGGKGDAATSGAPGQPGTIRRVALCPADLGARVGGDAHPRGLPDGTIVSMVLFGAERLYLNAASPTDLAALQDVLDYLGRLTSAPPSGPLAAKLAAIHARVDALRDNLSRGLDYFGKTPDFVTALSLEENQAYYGRFRDVARDLEADYDMFWQAEADDQKRRAAVTAQIHRAESLAENDLKPRLQRLQASARELDATITSLTVQSATEETQMNARLVTFEDALRAKRVWDTFTGVLRMAWSLVMLGVNGKSLFTSGIAVLGAAIDAMSAPTPSTTAPTTPGEAGDSTKATAATKDAAAAKEKVDHGGQAVAAFGKVKGNLGDIYAEYTKHVSAANWKDDGIKLVPETLDKAQFDAEIDAYLDVPGAEELRTAVHAYLDTVAQRNKAIVERDAIQRQLNGIHTQLTLIDRETGELARQREIDDDPQRAVFVQYLSAGMQLAKSFLVETLYMLSRSTDYYALTRTPLDLADFRVSALEKQYGETLEQLRKATVEVGSRAEVLCTHVIDDPVRLAALRSGATAWLSLRPTAGGALASPFANLQRPLVHRVQCFLEGAASPRAGAYATIAVEHGGISYVHDVASDSLWSFSHCPITTAFQYWLDDPRRELIDGDGREVTRSGDLTEGGRFMMPSPFAQWGLRIRPGDGENATLDLSRLARVVVRFWTKGKVAGLAASA